MGIGENIGENVGQNTGSSGKVISPPSGEEPIGTIFNDGFESGDMSVTNTDGFFWGATTNTSLVSRDADCSSLGTDVVIWNGATACIEVIPSVREWTAKEGKNSLRLRYAALVNWTEQELESNVGYQDLWVSYWIKVPINFARGSTGSPSNNKWFKMWMGTQALYDNALVTHFVTHDYPGSPSTTIDVDLDARSGSGTSSSSTLYPNFVTVADAGRWMHIVYHMKASSGGGATDGEASWYRMWEDESTYTTIANITNVEFEVTPTSIAAGYDGWGSAHIMGYANMPYDVDTEWLVDSFKLSENDLRIT